VAGYAGISGSISSEWVAVFAPEYLEPKRSYQIMKELQAVNHLV